MQMEAVGMPVARGEDFFQSLQRELGEECTLTPVGMDAGALSR